MSYESLMLGAIFDAIMDGPRRVMAFLIPDAIEGQCVDCHAEIPVDRSRCEKCFDDLQR